MKSEEKPGPQAAELGARCNELLKSLMESEDRFQKLFHASSNLMMITTLEEGRIVDVNEACGSVGGYKREELIGRFTSEQVLLADPNERNALIERIKSGNAHNLQMRIRRKNGEIRTVLFSADPITVNDEPGILSVSVDITAREEDKALRESEQKYRMVS